MGPPQLSVEEFASVIGIYPKDRKRNQSTRILESMDNGLLAPNFPVVLKLNKMPRIAAIKRAIE
jgi:hypothetical protein